VTAPLPVLVSGSVPGAGVVRHASIGIWPAHRKPVVVDVAAVHVVKVPVVQEVGMSFVADRGVSAARAMNVRFVVLMFRAAHVFAPLFLRA
jgi:hypothetical protein